MAAAKPAAPGPVTTQPAAPNRSAGDAAERHIVWVDTGDAELDTFCDQQADRAAEATLDGSAAAIVTAANGRGCDMAIVK